MRKTHFFVKHWVAAFAIAVLTVVIGVVSLQTLPVEQYPDIAPPMVTISATYSGADAHAVMESVIMPLEEVVNGVENMIYMDATATSNGEGEIDIYFKQGTDADQATVNVQNRVSQASGVLPEDVIRNGVTVQKNVNATLMIMSLESTDGQFDQSFISNYLDINVMPAISRIAGVGRTMVMGEQYGVRIWLKPDLMGLYGVTPDEIVAAINEQNLVVPIGRLESATDKIDIEFNGLLDDMKQFENIILRASEKGEILRLRDLAEVELGARAYDFRTNISGKPGVMFYVKQAPGANATKVNAEIKRVLVYTFIYEGAANWQTANGVVTLRYPGNEDVIVRMDEYNNARRMCAIALLENNGDDGFTVEKQVTFFDGHPQMDKAYNWGLRWVPGRK